MATPKVVTDGSSDLDEAVLNKFLSVPKLQVKINYLCIYFKASDNTVTVYGSADSDGEIVDGDLTWNAGSVWVDIVLTGFTANPIPLATIRTNSSTNIEKVRMVTSTAGTAATLVFLDNTTPGAATDPDGDVYVNVAFIGV